MVVILINGIKKLFHGHIARELKLNIIFEGSMEDCLLFLQLNKQLK